jgi:DNA helicase-2/ATP-dependent DNA helicase PcrA
MTQKYLSKLNSKQRSAATYGIKSPKIKRHRPLLIQAGAGTGKTRTLAARVTHLIANSVDPKRILLLAFGNKAAEELKNRASGEVFRTTKQSIDLVWSGTFHSVGDRLIREFASIVGLMPKFEFLSPADAVDLMGMCRDKVINKDGLPDKRTCAAVYKMFVGTRQDLKSILQQRDLPSKSKNVLSDLFAIYDREKQRRNVIDYEDQLRLFARLLRDKKTRQKLRRRFDYILVDEYQDTNNLQADILRRLAPNGLGLTVVGDEAQAIYGFRGANVENIRQFPSLYEAEVRTIKLTKNHRSSQEILTAANAILGQNDKLWSARRGQKPRLIRVANNASEASIVADQIQSRQKKGIPLSKIAVLCRESSDSYKLEVILAERKLPFTKVAGSPFADIKIVRDVRAVLTFWEKPTNDMAASRALQLVPSVGPSLARRLFEKIRLSRGHRDMAAITAGRVDPKAWLRFAKLMANLSDRNASLSDQLRNIRRWYATRGVKLSAADFAHLNQLEKMASNSNSLSDFLTALSSNQTSLPANNSGTTEGITISTIHAAKGREWDSVWILDVVDGHIPSRRTVDIEEERRLLHVAMTRPASQLTLMVPRATYSGIPFKGLRVALKLTQFIPPKDFRYYRSLSYDR